MAFNDPEMERKFDHWHRNQMVQLDVIKMVVSLFAVLAWVRKFRTMGADVEMTRVLSVFLFAINLAHGWLITSSRRGPVQVDRIRFTACVHQPLNLKRVCVRDTKTSHKTRNNIIFVCDILVSQDVLANSTVVPLRRGPRTCSIAPRFSWPFAR
jgi:hypothetical protein